MNAFKIPVYRPSLLGNERKYVNECLDSTWISSKGRFINEFESAFSKAVEVDHSISVCNGTVALHLALLVLGIGPSDEVIVPTLTYIASVNAITYTGATPIFVDADPVTWQMDPQDVLRHITPRTRALMPVHLYGQSCDMSSLMAIARDKRLFVIEDCAEAFGSRYKMQHVGSFGDLSAFSFFGNKTITTGEGGMVVTNDQTLASRARHFRGQGLADHREYWHDVVGYNYRMSNIAAAIGLAQLERADQIITQKRNLASTYKRALAGLPVEIHAEHPETIHSYWMISLLVSSPGHRDSLRIHLAQDGVETRPVFFPVHTMPMYAKKFRRYPVAESIAWRGINLPSWPDMTEDDVNHVVFSIRRYFAKH
jgi:perosamine synthetase